jgi:hypothetical protein
MNSTKAIFWRCPSLWGLARQRPVLRILGVLAVAAFLVSYASASPIVGSINISDTCTGSGCTSGVTVSGTTIDWFPPSGGGNGSFQVGGTTGSFSSSGPFGNFSGLSGLLLDLNTTNEPTGSVFPLGGPIVSLAGEGNVLPGFMTFSTAPQSQVVFDLKAIAPGVFSSAACTAAPAPGQTCTPSPTSPFNLTNGADNTSTASLTLSGFVRRTDTGELSTFTGTFTTQFAPCTAQITTSCGFYQNWLPVLAAGGSVSNTYSASFSATATAVPEPSTEVMLIAGLVLIAGATIRRRSNSRA